MRPRTRYPLIASAAVALLAGSMNAANGSAPISDVSLTGTGGVGGTIPADVEPQMLPEGLELLDSLPENSESRVPAETRDAVVALQLSAFDDRITQYAWDDATQTLRLHVAGDAEPIINAVAVHAPDQAVAVEAAVRDSATLDAVLERFVEAGGVLPNGVRATSAWAEPDGSAIVVGLDMSSAARLAPTELEGIPVVYESTGTPEAVTRSRTTGQVFTGGAMNFSPSTNSYNWCTTGFPVRRNADAEAGMLSADHCASAINQTWRWGKTGSTVSVGFSTGWYNSTDHEVWRQTQNPSVYTLVGASTVSNSVAPIRGYYSAIVGDSVCYNGAFSGTVCGNPVERTGYAVCYFSGECYSQLTVTYSDSPAAGNGDSGGPVVAFGTASDGSIGAYGAGIISGILFPNDNCAGDAATTTRKCSGHVLYAPVVAFASGNTAFSLLVAPTP